MNWTVRLLCVPVLGWMTMLKAESDDGALPRGKTPAPGHKPPVSEAAGPAAATPEPADCTSYIANPESGELYFAQDGKLVYFLSRQAGETAPEGKGFLYEVDLENLRSKRIVSLKIGDNAALVGHGQPLEAMTVLDFHRARVGCGEGSSAGIGIKWIGKQKIIKSYPQGSYKIVASDKGPIVADMELSNIKLLDLNTFQKRTLTSFPARFYPLFLRSAPLQLIGFKPEQDELVRLDDHDPEPSAVLKLKKGMRLVQDQDQFGIVTSGDAGRILQVKQIKGWSGDAFRGIDIRLPDGVLADRVGVNVDFRTGICLVQGANPDLRREMRQVLIYNSAKGQMDKILKAPEGQYFSQAVFGQRGRKIVVLSRSLLDDGVQSIRVGDAATGEWRELPIVRDGEKSGEKASTVEVSAEKPTEKPAPEKVEKAVPAATKKLPD
ncbi:MAG TPA: hypothetical protein VFO10_27320 [Oligoflexus sp.]|uniref:hypothetical protein n=1 Tax=Oligoflexus sp. TaxID=1971216 RepID=UPI002D7ED6A7|nr:hypothetical protein [Oligoflexus sp.]HET9241007.1 hypothetical protein [Oligoflexus sp.]